MRGSLRTGTAAGTEPGPAEAIRLHRQYGPGSFSLNDLGYIAKVHPLEIWTAKYLAEHPSASEKEIDGASAAERQAVYEWLFKPGRRAAQDSRIQTILEEDAFRQIHKEWSRLGYPFDHLVPSYATAIGSSADRPGALAELMGIIVNNGVKRPTIRIQNLHFASDTPFETHLARRPETGEQVMVPEVAQTVRAALTDIVENGTARRVRGALDAPGKPTLAIGGKTGTGDHRFGDRAVARTATFVFFLGEHHFGTITAHVRGPDVDSYGFTSALPVQLLKTLAPSLAPLIHQDPIEKEGQERLTLEVEGGQL